MRCHGYLSFHSFKRVTITRNFETFVVKKIQTAANNCFIISNNTIFSLIGIKIILTNKIHLSFFYRTQKDDKTFLIT